MKNYVLVMKNGRGYKVGRNQYTQSQAIKRQQALFEMGIQMEVMTFDEACGAN